MKDYLYSLNMTIGQGLGTRKYIAKGVDYKTRKKTNKGLSHMSCTTGVEKIEG